VLDIRGVFSNVGEMSGLPSRPWLRNPPQGESEQLVVGQQDKPPPLQHVAEVAYAGDAGEELPVEGGVSGLRRLQLLGKEAQRLPDRRPLAALVQASSDMSR
jgi:hypothetical protein